MPPVTIDELDFIDSDSTATCSKGKGDVRQLIGKLEKLRMSPVFQVVLRIQALAKLYEEQTRLAQRNVLLKQKLDDRANSNRIQMAKLEVLRADRRKRQENISNINLKIIDETNLISSETEALLTSKQSIAEIKEQAIMRSKEVLRDYLSFINGRNIIGGLSSSTPQIKPRPFAVKSSKNKKLLDEASILADSHNISRFLNVSSSIFQCPLRFPLKWNGLTTHQLNPESEYFQISFSDLQSPHFLRCVIEQLNAIKLVKKNRNLVGFIDASSKVQMTNSIQLNRNANVKSASMRDALFSQNRKIAMPSQAKKFIGEEIPDFT